MGNEHEFEVPIDFNVGDFYRLAKNWADKYGTQVTLRVEHNKIVAEVEDERV